MGQGFAVVPDACSRRIRRRGRRTALLVIALRSCRSEPRNHKRRSQSRRGRCADVAGDENCVAIVRGGRVERFSLWRSPDLMATVARVAHEALGAKPRRIYVDAGGVGGGVVDRLKQLRYDVEGIQFGGRANDSSRFANRRAEMYWTLRERLEDGLAIPDDDQLITD